MSKANVAYFPGNSIPRDGVIPEIVEQLEHALAQAKNGELVAVALVKVRRQPRGFAQGWHTEPGTRHDLAAGVLAIHHRVGAALNED